MKNLALKDVDVQELNANEMLTIEGGGLFATRGQRIAELVESLEQHAKDTVGAIDELLGNVGKALL